MHPSLGLRLIAAPFNPTPWPSMIHTQFMKRQDEEYQVVGFAKAGLYFSGGYAFEQFEPPQYYDDYSGSDDDEDGSMASLDHPDQKE